MSTWSPWLLALWGCAGTMEQIRPNEAQLSELYGEIQVEEARLQHALQGYGAGPVDEQAQRVRRICKAAARICQLARDTREMDANIRCDRATRQCTNMASGAPHCPEFKKALSLDADGGARSSDGV